MKKKIFGILASVALVFSCLCFTSCEDILNMLFPDLFGKITSVSAVPADKMAIVSWSNGSISSYSLHVSYESASTDKQVIDIEENNNYLMIEGLKNGVEYTFTVYVTDSTGAVEDSKSTTATPSADSVTTHAYKSNSATSMFEVPAKSGVITLSGVKGKRITYANYNKGTSSAISSTAVRKYIGTNGSGLSASTSLEARTADDDTLPQLEEPAIRHFTPPELKYDVLSRAGTESRGGTFKKDDPKVGQTLDIYVDQGNVDSLTSYAYERMSLYAIGYVPTSDDSKQKDEIKCLVWANPENVVEAGQSKDDKISIGVIKDLVEKFIWHYQLEESIFGETSDKMFNLNSTETTSMMDYPTKNYINIVLTDIGKDKTAGTCGVVGYFWAKDYYEGYTGSNEGKYFYIDIPYSNYSSKNKNYNGIVDKESNDLISDTALSTLFHEYQHMIDFNTKQGVTTGGQADVWFNEMLSMLCEDLMQDELGMEEKIQDGRIKNFNGYYYYSGTAQYVTQNSWVSYGTAYAFGSWLARNYGGAKLVTEMSKNDSWGRDSVVKAVNKVNNTSKTWDDLMKEYIQACAFRAKYQSDKSLPTHNVVPTSENSKLEVKVPPITVTSATVVDVASYLNSKEKYTEYTVDSGSSSAVTLTASFKTGINMWKDTYKNESSAATYYGPILTKVGVNVDLQPTGFIFHPIGKATSDSVTLFFSGQNNADDVVYIFIQDDFSTTTEDTTAEKTY